MGAPAAPHIPGLKKYTQPPTVSLPFLSQLLECTRCIRFLSETLLNPIQDSSHPRHFPEASPAKVSSNMLTAKKNGTSPSWCSLTYVQNLTLQITNYTTLFLASEPFSSFSLPLTSSALETLHPLIPRFHFPWDYLHILQISYFMYYGLADGRYQALFTLEFQCLDSTCKITGTQKRFVDFNAHIE